MPVKIKLVIAVQCDECPTKNDNVISSINMDGLIRARATHIQVLKDRHWKITHKRVLCPKCNGYITCPECFMHFKEDKLLIALEANLEICPLCKTEFDTNKGGIALNAQVTEELE